MNVMMKAYDTQHFRRTTERPSGRMLDELVEAMPSKNGLSTRAHVLT
jgi:hypothetical protein